MGDSLNVVSSRIPSSPCETGTRTPREMSETKGKSHWHDVRRLLTASEVPQATLPKRQNVSISITPQQPTVNTAHWIHEKSHVAESDAFAFERGKHRMSLTRQVRMYNSYRSWFSRAPKLAGTPRDRCEALTDRQLQSNVHENMSCGNAQRRHSETFSILELSRTLDS